MVKKNITEILDERDKWKSRADLTEVERDESRRALAETLKSRDEWIARVQRTEKLSGARLNNLVNRSLELEKALGEIEKLKQMVGLPITLGKTSQSFLKVNYDWQANKIASLEGELANARTNKSDLEYYQKLAGDYAVEIRNLTEDLRKNGLRNLQYLQRGAEFRNEHGILWQDAAENLKLINKNLEVRVKDREKEIARLRMNIYHARSELGRS